MENNKKILPALQVVLFQLGHETFGVDILQVLEVVRMQPISYVPETPDFVEGVINLRGNVVPIINLRKKFGLPTTTPHKQSRIIIFELNEKMTGAIVDGVDQIFQIPEESIESPPKMAATEIQQYISGVGKLESGLVILLDIQRVLTEKEIIQLNELDSLKNMIKKKEADRKKKKKKKKDQSSEDIKKTSGKKKK